jgi:hypothetical protein
VLCGVAEKTDAGAVELRGPDAKKGPTRSDDVKLPTLLLALTHDLLLSLRANHFPFHLAPALLAVGLFAIPAPFETVTAFSRK